METARRPRLPKLRPFLSDPGELACRLLIFKAASLGTPPGDVNLAASALEATEAAFFVRWSPGAHGTKSFDMVFEWRFCRRCVTGMNNPDHDTLVRAIEDARRILGEYLEPWTARCGAEGGTSAGCTRQPDTLK